MTCIQGHTDRCADAQQHLHSGPDPHYNHAKEELCTNPYLELCLDRWMEQNCPISLKMHLTCLALGPIHVHSLP